MPIRGPAKGFIAVLCGLTLLSVLVLSRGAAPVTRAAGQAPTGSAASTDVAALHIVGRGETLAGIAQRYGVAPDALAAYNDIVDARRIYVGRVLRIPPQFVAPTLTATTTATPASSAMPTPACACEEIVILEPRQGVTVTNPITVSGIASSPFEQALAVRVLDGSGQEIGVTVGTLAGPVGAPIDAARPYTITVAYTPPANHQPGRVQVFGESPRDGAIEHLSSVSVNLTGLGLDPLLAALEQGIAAKDYAALQTLMGPAFRLGGDGAGWRELTPAEAARRLQAELLGPGRPWLDFSRDANAMLAEAVTLPAGTAFVVYSPGWGRAADGEALLLIGNEGGQARWSGMFYVSHEAR
jgi:LysM repeat protein